MTQELMGYLARVGNALLACPCHLLITAALLAGTILEGTNSDNSGLVAIGIAGFFLLALVLAARIFATAEARPESEVLWKDSNDTLGCDTCADRSLLDRLSLDDPLQHKRGAAHRGRHG